MERITKTDNKSIGNKVFLRKQAIRNFGEVKVLDLFAGNNVLWRNIKTDRYYGVEIVPNKGANLNADAWQVVNSLDLSNFNVIDVDSYGVPFEICRKILLDDNVKSGTVVLYTAITNDFTQIPMVGIEESGVKEIFNTVPTLFNRNAVDFFYDMLGKYGVKSLNYYESNDQYIKHYGYFIKP